MAERTSSEQDLLVTFSREGEIEQQARCQDSEAALKAGMLFLLTQDGLHAGDRLTVEWARRPNLTERGLA
jgi:transcriptional regulator GlxA family with amidase domain